MADTNIQNCCSAHCLEYGASALLLNFEDFIVNPKLAGNHSGFQRFLTIKYQAN